MTRITTSIFVFMILINGSVSIMAATGMNDDLDVDLAPGISNTVNDAVEKLQKGFRPSTGLGQTLFTLFLAGLDVFSIIVKSVGALPTMLINLGFPKTIVSVMVLPLYAISTLELVYVATGRDLV